MDGIVYFRYDTINDLFLITRDIIHGRSTAPRGARGLFSDHFAMLSWAWGPMCIFVHQSNSIIFFVLSFEVVFVFIYETIIRIPLLPGFPRWMHILAPCCIVTTRRIIFHVFLLVLASPDALFCFFFFFVVFAILITIVVISFTVFS